MVMENNSDSFDLSVFEDVDWNWNILQKQFFDVFLPGMRGDVQGVMFFKSMCINLPQIHANRDWMNHSLPRYCIIFLYAFIGVFGVVANFTLVASIVFNLKDLTSSRIFLVNLGQSSLLLCFTSIPFTPWYAMGKTWPFNAVWSCHLLPLCQGLSIVVTANSLSCMALQRYMQIVHPSARRWSRRFAIFCTLINWVFGVVLHLPISFAMTLYDTHREMKLCRHYCVEKWDKMGGVTGKRVYSTLAVVFQFILPLVIFCYCNLRIYLVIKSDMIADGSLAGVTNRRRRVARRLRVSLLLLAMVVLFITCWSAIFVPLTMSDFGFTQQIRWWNDEYSWSGFLRLLTYAIAFSSVLWNPVLYFWISAKQREDAFQILRTVTNKLSKTLSNRLPMSNRDPDVTQVPASSRRQFLNNDTVTKPSTTCSVTKCHNYCKDTKIAPRQKVRIIAEANIREENMEMMPMEMMPILEANVRVEITPMRRPSNHTYTFVVHANTTSSSGEYC